MPGNAKAKPPDRVIQGLQFARRPELLAFLPAVTLAAFWLGGENALILTALAIPGLYAMAGLLMPTLLPDMSTQQPRDSLTGLLLREALVEKLDRDCDPERSDGRSSACIVLSIDDAEIVARQHGSQHFAEVMRRTAERLGALLRDGDTLARIDQSRFAATPAPGYRIDLESMLQMAGRLQQAAESAFMLNGQSARLTISAGLALPQSLPVPGGEALLEAAELALDDARRNGPGAIRAFTCSLRKAHNDLRALRNRMGPALQNGEFQPHFQPQISTDTGEVTGFETLVRWHHPDRGVLAPEQFLPELLASGLAEQLGDVMLGGALRQMALWEARALHVPSIAVNFSPEELRNPRLTDKVQWELDRHGLAPEQLTIEVLETVVAHANDDMVVQTLRSLARLGCQIDLDDFGTGQASISNIRRFGVTRIKIDRCFVSRIDEDKEQQRLVAAILSLAERLGLETLAEGVETPAEHAMLAQLGCDIVQGFAIARPMPAEAVPAWLTEHRRRIPNAGINPQEVKRRQG